jgi:1-deoxy-D-xylulose-5-phosphate synthase
LQLGLPDRFVDHGKHQELLSECGLDAEGIEQAIADRLQKLSQPNLAAGK